MDRMSAPPLSQLRRPPSQPPRRISSARLGPHLSQEARLELVAIWLAAAASAGLTLLAAARYATPQHPYLEVNPLAAAYLTLSPAAFVAMKLVGLLLGSIGLVRASPHVPRLMTWVLRVLAVVTLADVAWDALQLLGGFRLL